ncbi:enoyl-CoA hydratase, partial [candidate division KSB1 bacterium]
MEEYENLKFESKGGVAFVTVDRPEVLNALNVSTILELMAVFSKIKIDQDVKVAILTGSGEKSFVAGADIRELSKYTSIGGKDFSVQGQQIFNLIEELGKPVIAAVNGFALGGGLELAMACTIRIASDNAKFGQPEVGLGLIPGFGGTQRLPRLVGKGRAMELILTGDMISAEEALRIGLVNKVVPQKDLISEAELIAQKIMQNSPIAVKFAMEAINKGLETSLSEGLSLEANLFGLACSTEDMKEGTKAFLE